MVVIQPRLALLATTPRRPRLAPVMPAAVPTSAASMVIWRRMCERLPGQRRRAQPIGVPYPCHN